MDLKQALDRARIALSLAIVKSATQGGEEAINGVDDALTAYTDAILALAEAGEGR